MYYSSYEIVREQQYSNTANESDTSAREHHKNSLPQLWRRWRRQHRRQQHHQRKQWNEKLKQTPEDDEKIYTQYIWRKKFCALLLECCFDSFASATSSFGFCFYFYLLFFADYSLGFWLPRRLSDIYIEAHWIRNTVKNVLHLMHGEGEGEKEISGGCVAAQRTSIHLDK